ncbi:MAG: hypothetical protein CMM74_12480, partial [Rhodospirillaceae bacterium]|nr:hypothetical protein [Rhodospirillaceae bacterium]
SQASLAVEALEIVYEFVTTYIDQYGGEQTYDQSDQDNYGLAALGYQESLQGVVTNAAEASSVSDEISLATQNLMLSAVQTIFEDGYISEMPTSAADAQTSVLAAISELGADPKVNSMAQSLLSDATDFVNNAILNYDTAKQSAVSAGGFSANASAQAAVALAGEQEFAEKRTIANEAAINEAKQAVLGAKNALAGSKADALDAADDAFANADTAITAAKTTIDQAYTYEREKAIDDGASESIIENIEAYVRGERDAPPTNLENIPEFLMPMYDLLQAVNSAETKVKDKIGGDETVTAADVSSQLSEVVTKTSALIETTSQAFSVLFEGAVEKDDVFSLTIGGTAVSYTVISADVDASKLVSSPISVVRDKLLEAVQNTSDIGVTPSAAFSGNELVLTVPAASGAISISEEPGTDKLTVSVTDEGDSKTDSNIANAGLTVSATGIESALLGLKTSLTALSNVTGAIGDAVDIVVANANASEVYSATVDTRAADMAATEVNDEIKTAINEASAAAQNAQALVSSTQGEADLARAQAIYSESSSAQALAGKAQFAQSLAKTIQEEALKIAQELANARPVAEDDVRTGNDAIDEDTSVVIDLLQNDTRADGGDLVGATLLSVGAATNGDVEILAQQEVVTFSGAGAGITYTLSIDGNEISYRGLSYENAAAVANKVIEAINGNAEINSAVVASSDSDGVVRVTALQTGQPFVLAEEDGNIAVANDVANGEVRFTPNDNFNGNDSFTYTVANDAEVPSYSSATVRVEVSPVNDDPTTVDDFGTVVSSAGTSVRVLSNDSDIDGDTLSITEVTFEGVTRSISEEGETTITGATTGSQIVVNPTSGRINFIPDSDWYKGLADGTVEQKIVTYKAQDPSGAEADPPVAIPATLTLTVQGVNDAPEVTSSAITFNGTEDNIDSETEQPIPVTGDLSDFASDPDSGASLTYSIAAGGDPENGSLTLGNDGTFSYLPNDDYYGADSFIFRVVDDKGVAATKSVTIDIASVNDAPDVVNEAVALAANKSVVLRILDNDSDKEGQDISLKLGSVSFDGPAGAVTAVQNDDGTITITPDPDHALFVDLGKGQAAASQTISYVVQDTEGGETTGQVDLSVLGVEGPPVAGDDTANVTEGGNVVIDVLANDSDKDGDTLRVLTPNAGQYGTTVLNEDGTVTYTASASTLESLAVGDSLNDTFSYSVTDGTNFTEASVTVTIAGENDIPLSTADVARARENGDNALIDILYNDRDLDAGDTLSLYMPELVTDKGAMLTTVAADRIVLGGTLETGDTYAVTVTISDEATTLTHTVTDADTEIADVELGLIELINTHETVSGLLLASSGPANGVLLISAKNSDTSFSTAVAAANTASGDFDDASATATRTTVVAYDPVTVQVTQVDLSQWTAEDIVPEGVYSISVGDNSATVEVPSVSSFTLGAAGTSVPVPPMSVSELVSALGQAINASALRTDIVASANDTALTLKGADLTAFTANVLLDGAPLNQTEGHPIASVTVSGPDAFDAMTTGDKKVDTFSYKALDTANESDHSAIETTRVNITVSGANDRPNAVSETSAVDVVEDGQPVAIDVLANDTDADEDDTYATLIVNSATSEKGANVTIENGKVVYDPNDVEAFQSLGVGETTTDTVTYTIRDAIGAVSNEATVTMTVTGTNDIPVASAEKFSAFKGSAFSVDDAASGLLANDTDPDTSDQDSLEVVAGEIVSPTTGVTVTINSDGTFEYDPIDPETGKPLPAFDGLGNNQTLIDTFQYTVIDPQGAEAVSTAIVEVTGTLPSEERQLSGDEEEPITLDAVVQEVIKGTLGNNDVELSGKAIAGDVFDGGDGSDTLILDDSGNEIAIENTETVTGGAGDDDIEIRSPGTGGVAVSSGGGTDKVSLDAGFTVNSATLSGDDLVVSADYVDPDDTAAESEAVTVTLSDHATSPFSSIEFDVDGDGTVDSDSEVFSIATGGDASASTDDALVVGSAGDDTLVGGGNNDLLIGGAGDDDVDGGAGDDIIQIGAGSDTIDGGEGTDTLSLSSLDSGATVDLAEGKATVGSDEDTIIRDDGISTIENVSGGDFADTITGDSGANVIDGGGAGDVIDAGGGNDLVVGGDGSDRLEGGSGDDVIYGDAISVTEVSGETPSGLAIAQSLELIGMPAAEFGDVKILSDKEVRGFESDDLPSGPTTSMVPDDAGFENQWYLDNPNAALGGIDIDITSIWDEYSGAGITLGIIDDGIDYLHPDIAGNYNLDIDYDALDGVLGLGSGDPISDGLDDFHGTAVAGVMAGSLGEGDIVGVAHEASLAMFRMGFGFEASASQTEAALQQMVNVDVVNSSWTYGEAFTDNKNELKSAEFFEAITEAVEVGREGLGTTIVFAAGNYGEIGDSSDYHSFSNTHETISVGSVGQFGSASSFTSAGSSVLISAPGESILTTDLSGAAGFSVG